jgi:hypothetical protein
VDDAAERTPVIMRRLAVMLTIPVALAAQVPKASGARDGVMTEFEIFADLFGNRLVAAFDSIPASRYGYSPTALQQSVGYIAQHLEAANYGLCTQFSDLKYRPTAKDSASDSAKARWPKDTLVARLRASVRFCDEALARTPHVSSAALASVLLAFETDLAEHYSQISSYMRMLGLVPPSAIPPRARVAVTLAGSLLAQYAGTYEVSAGVTLDVAVRDGALTIQSPANITPVSLFAEHIDEFFATEIDAQISFTRNEAGNVAGLVVHRFGGDRPAKKVR